MVFLTVIKIYAANVRPIGWGTTVCEREKKSKKSEITLRTSFFIDKISIREKSRHWNRLWNTLKYRYAKNGNGNFIISLCSFSLRLLLMFV